MAKISKPSTKTDADEKKVIKKAVSKSTPKGGNGLKCKYVHFSYFDPYAHQVSLAGDFNDWSHNACLLERKDSGEWNTDIRLKPGIYDYRFIVDGEWREDPASSERVPNPFGTLNNRIIIK